LSDAPEEDENNEEADTPDRGVFRGDGMGVRTLPPQPYSMVFHQIANLLTV
jgi:hypothetical protein